MCTRILYYFRPCSIRAHARYTHYIERRDKDYNDNVKHEYTDGETMWGGCAISLRYK